MTKSPHLIGDAWKDCIHSTSGIRGFEEHSTSLVCGRIVEVLSKVKIDKAQSIPIDQLLTESKRHIHDMAFSMHGGEYILEEERHISYVIPLLQEYQKELRKRREDPEIQRDMKRQAKWRLQYEREKASKREGK